MSTTHHTAPRAHKPASSLGRDSRQDTEEGRARELDRLGSGVLRLRRVRHRRGTGAEPSLLPGGCIPGVAILLSMGTVGVAYVVRPLGALIMGPLGDKYGRKFVLMLTLFMMGGATFAVGCLPTYDQAGLLAPALLVLCRVIQGLSASGEQASAISVSLEHSDDRHRAFTTSWTLQAPSSAPCWQPPCSSPSP
nr:MFS transporter [Kocuria atrinae]